MHPHDPADEPGASRGSPGSSRCGGQPSGSISPNTPLPTPALAAAALATAGGVSTAATDTPPRRRLGTWHDRPTSANTRVPARRASTPAAAASAAAATILAAVLALLVLSHGGRSGGRTDTSSGSGGGDRVQVDVGGSFFRAWNLGGGSGDSVGGGGGGVGDAYALTHLQLRRRLGQPLRHDERDPSATPARVAEYRKNEALGLRDTARGAVSRPRRRNAEKRRVGLLDAAGGGRGERGDRGLAVVGGDEAVGGRAGVDEKGWEDGEEGGGVDLWRREQRQRRRLRRRSPDVGEEEVAGERIWVLGTGVDGARHGGNGSGWGGGQSRSLTAKPFGRLKEVTQRRCFASREDRKDGGEGAGGGLRCHANVFFFGVSKCGTTSLAHWMSEHPELRWVSNPEVHGHHRLGAEAHVLEMLGKKDYARVVYPVTAPQASPEDPVVDYTPHYSILAEVPYRIADMYGQQTRDGSFKYVAILREPVARTISSWQFKYDLSGIERGDHDSSSSERRSLKEAFEEGAGRVEALMDCLSTKLNPSNMSAPQWLKMKRVVDVHTCNPRRFLEHNEYFSHVGKSVYHLQLERWIDLFRRENVEVLFLEEMAADPVETLSSVIDFLGMSLVDEAEGKKGLRSREEWQRIVERSHNLTDLRKKELLDKQVTPEIVESMRRFFAPHNRMLQEQLGRPLPDNWST